MRIHNSPPDDQFTALPNAMLRDERLSYMARGVLAEILSRPDGWAANADTLSRLAKQHRAGMSSEGRRAIRAAFAELEELGYMVRTMTRGERGRFATDLLVYDTPGHRSDVPANMRLHRPQAAYLYRQWDKDDRLLYIGITRSIRQRERGHAKSSRWMELVVRTTTERHQSRGAAEVAEVAAIAAEQPLFNVAGNETPEAHRRLVEYLVAHGRTDLLAPAVSRG